MNSASSLVAQPGVRRTALLLLLLCAFAPLREISAAPHPSLPQPVVPECLGVNIHFTDPKPGEMEMLAAAGFKWVRMDFTWSATEKKPGEYDFSAYDRLVAKLDEHKLRAVFILDYGNPLYAEPGDKHPFTSRAGTPEFREAFAKWAVAAVSHFKGRGYLWELWNEPNHDGFWKPKPSAANYAALAKATAAALRAAGLTREGEAPAEPKTSGSESLGSAGASPSRKAGECFIGPATSTIDLPFLEECFKAGLLADWDAVSVHPYRQQAPETVEEEYRSLRLLIRKYAPSGKDIPIISGEWGYSTQYPAFAGKDPAARDEMQAKYLARQFLTNIANDVALSIWYDWHDDGTNPTEAEHHFGLVRHEYHADRDPVYDPKPAYTAMKTLTEQLGGISFNKSIVVTDQSWKEQLDSHALVFSGGTSQKVAFWVDGPQRDPELEIHLPVSTGKFRLQPILDKRLGYEAESGKDGLVLKPDHRDVLIITPVEPNDFLQIAAASLRLPLDFVYRWPGNPLLPVPILAEPSGLRDPQMSSTSYHAASGGGLRVEVQNPLTSPVRLLFGFSSIPNFHSLQPGETFERTYGVESVRRKARYRDSLEHAIEFKGKQTLRLTQATTLICTNPLAAEVYPPSSNGLPIRVSNPSGEPLLGIITVSINPFGLGSVEDLPPASIRFAEGEREKIVLVPYANKSELGKITVTVRQDYATAHGEGRNAPVWDEEFPALLPQPPLKASEIRATADGDGKVESFSDVEDALPVEGPSISEASAVKVGYRFGVGWKFVQLSGKERKMESVKREGMDAPPLSPTGFGLWLHGDGKGLQPRVRFKDSTGQVFQPDGPKIDWKGWRYVTFPMQTTEDKPLAHWGGKNDGEIHYPIEWDSIFLLDNIERKPVEGEIYLSAPTLIY